MNKIIIVGSGPVGSFMAVLCALLSYKVTVYEKRQNFTRNINLKIESNFFKEVHEVISRLNVRSDFFLLLNNFLQSQKNRVLIKDLEVRFSQEAKLLGVQYVTREIKSFDEVYHEHASSNPIILDCTGRNSKLRVDEFGMDEDNLVTTPLQNAMYINFKAKLIGSLSLYQAMKYVNEIKLSEVIVSRKTDDKGFSNVTIPAFITERLAQIFNKEFPDINRNPLNPFNSSKPISKEIFFPISSLLGNLLTDGCAIDLSSVSVKKIEISCGYAKKRSRNNLICLGDSAVYLAFFKSLCFGFKHGLELFVRLSMQRSENHSSIDVLKEFRRDNPHLIPVKYYPTKGKNVFLVVTRIVLFGCFSYCYTNRETTRLTNMVGVAENKIDQILQELNRQLTSWSLLLINYEAKRDRDILLEVRNNKDKNVLYDHASWAIGLGGQSMIKLSEFGRAMQGRCLLVQKDFEFIFRLFEERRNVLNTLPSGVMHSTLLVRIIKRLISHGESARLNELYSICSSQIPDEEKINLLSATSEKSENKINKLMQVLNVSAASVGAYSTTDNINSIFILNVVKNEIAIYRLCGIETNNRNSAEIAAKNYDFFCTDSKLNLSLTDDVDLITF